MPRFSAPLMVAAWLMCSAAGAADDGFIGVWKLDPSRSRLTDQMKVEDRGGGKYAFDFGAGTETVIADGTDQPGYAGTTLAVTLEGPDALKVVRKKDGRMLLTADWELSKDGKSLTDDFTSFTPGQESSNLKYVYQRTTDTTGFAGTWESASAKVNFDLTIRIQPYGEHGLSIVSPFSDRPKDLSFDGRDYPNRNSSAPAGSLYSARRQDERSLEITDKVGGKAVDTQTYTLSADLKTLTLTVRKPGMRVPSLYVFARQ